MSGQVEALAQVVLQALRDVWRDNYSVASVADGVSRAVLTSDWLRDHDRALRESIAADIEALPEFSQTLGYEALYRKGLDHAAKVARSEQP